MHLCCLLIKYSDSDYSELPSNILLEHFNTQKTYIKWKNNI